MIHDFMNLPPDFILRECGTQEYEADVVSLEKRGNSSFLYSSCIVTELTVFPYDGNITVYGCVKPVKYSASGDTCALFVYFSQG